MTQPEKGKLKFYLSKLWLWGPWGLEQSLRFGGGGRDQQNKKSITGTPDDNEDQCFFGPNKLNQIPQQLKYQRYAHSSCSDILIKCTGPMFFHKLEWCIRSTSFMILSIVSQREKKQIFQVLCLCILKNSRLKLHLALRWAAIILFAGTAFHNLSWLSYFG